MTHQSLTDVNMNDMEKGQEFVDEELIVPPKTLDELCIELRKVFAKDRVKEEYVNMVKALLSSYRSNPRDWRKYAKFDPHKYVLWINGIKIIIYLLIGLQ